MDLIIVIHISLKRIFKKLEILIKVFKLFHDLVLKYSIITNPSDISKSNKV